MSAAPPLLWLGCVLGVAAVALLRFAWSRPRRSAALNLAAWTALVASVASAWQAAGAWGVTVSSLVTTGAAFILLAIAGATAPAGREKASDRRVGMLPGAGEPKRIGRRLGTFLIVMIGGMLASIAIAVAVRGLGDLLGWSPANSNTLALYTPVIAWALLASVLLMQIRRRSQIMTLLICFLAAAPFILIGAK